MQRFAHCNWSLVPHHLHRQLERWLVDGAMPKSRFLYAVLRGDHEAATHEASIAELAALADLISFLTLECPPQAYGNHANVFAWAELKGWIGMRDASEGMEEKIYEHPHWRGRLWKPGCDADEEE